MKILPGYKAYIIANGNRIEEVLILKAGEMVTVQPKGSDGAIRVRKNRLFTKKDAEAYLKAHSDRE